MEWVVTNGNQTDVPRCLAIAKSLPGYFNQTGLESMGRDLSSSVLAGVGARLLVAKVFSTSTIAGFLCLRKKDQLVAEILWMAVEGSLAGRGIGTLMLDTVSQELSSRGIRLLTVKTLAPSVNYAPYERTRRLYEKNGFLLCEVIDPYPGWDPGNPCAIYVKPLVSRPVS